MNSKNKVLAGAAEWWQVTAAGGLHGPISDSASGAIEAWIDLRLIRSNGDFKRLDMWQIWNGHSCRLARATSLKGLARARKQRVKDPLCLHPTWREQWDDGDWEFVP